MNSIELKALTNRQQEIFDYIAECLSDFNAPPTRAEIANHFGFRSANAAEDHLKALAKKGYIELKSGTSRGIHVNPTLLANAQEQVSSSGLAKQGSNTPETQGLAVIGNVAAGEPMLAQEHIQQYVNVESHLFSDTADFLLKVKGDSMINVGIFEQDLLAVKKTTQARDNQIVVARIGDDVTVKRFTQNGQHISLIAENDAYSPIEVDLAEQDFAIEGVVVGLIRQGI